MSFDNSAFLELIAMVNKEHNVLTRDSEHPKFKIWHTIQVYEYNQGRTIQHEIDEMMQSKFLKIEIKDKKGKWVEDEPST